MSGADHGHDHHADDGHDPATASVSDHPHGGSHDDDHHAEAPALGPIDWKLSR